MVSAVWNGVTLASSDETVVVDGNHYFPPHSIDRQCLEPSEHTSVCPVKGTAQYFHVRVGDQRNSNAAWTYADPSPAAHSIQHHIAFWKGIEIA
ncbi:DUF427 domain-containing protein [Rhizobium pusense]|uniref:DUF427 domain-containing protein n=1 Tax=Agrobacterium pusense TaxID=648995 RepID=UPI000D1AAFD3|nr:MULTISPECIES: DUF427 domain-containing protein [Alphaproteobacteria]MDH0908506.1 DUF427 domain-containing protein [Agrobacterium pusense]MDH1094338.1 DUF427 domain-containing protein [Agrobacterium pusense]MDH1110920.1 DUF427 domain-containing protein [Agrobacterium pusense]MDH2192076.1 DUF427 domain-containing protein [Agrobacterium pusense]